MVASLQRDRDQEIELWGKRFKALFDYLKTLCFGFIGAAVLSPTFKHPAEAIQPGGYAVIIVCSVILGLMVWFANVTR